MFEPETYRANRTAVGYTTGYCLIVSRELLVRCRAEREVISDTATLCRLARLLKKCAFDRSGVTVAPDLKSGSTGNGIDRWPSLSEFMGVHGAPPFLARRGLLCGILPETEFDGLDMSCAIDEAVRTQWVSHGYRGMFRQIACQLEGQYDVVCLFHYLEHATDPAEEIRAAHAVLAPGGLIFIEVPNPECLYARVFDRLWGGWLQPQHLNLLSVRNLDRMLEENGFEPVWLEGTHGQPQHDVTLSALLFMKWLAPKTGMPWQPTPTLLDPVLAVLSGYLVAL